MTKYTKFRVHLRSQQTLIVHAQSFTIDAAADGTVQRWLAEGLKPDVTRPLYISPQEIAAVELTVSEYAKYAVVYVPET